MVYLCRMSSLPWTIQESKVAENTLSWRSRAELLVDATEVKVFRFEVFLLSCKSIKDDVGRNSFLRS